MKASPRAPGAFAEGAAEVLSQEGSLFTADTATGPVALILFGSPGSGKGTQAKLLKRCFNGPHVSTGDMLRSHIGLNDEIGVQSENLIKSGKLVPDDLVNCLVEERLRKPDAKQHGAILDGYPRTRNQAAVLLNLLQADGFRPVVVHLVVDYEKIVARLSGRRQCPVCETLYSLTTNPPRVPGHCDREGAILVTREDDREPVIRERLAGYDRQTVPVLNFFSEAGVARIDVDAGEASPQEILERICQSLEATRLVDAPAKKSLV